MMSTDVDADFFHGTNGQRMNPVLGLGAGAIYLDLIALETTNKALGHLTTTRIAGAKHQQFQSVLHAHSKYERHAARCRAAWLGRSFATAGAARKRTARGIRWAIRAAWAAWRSCRH